MFKWFSKNDNSFPRRDNDKKKTTESRLELEKKVKEGTKFAIDKYGDVLEALAKFDKVSN
jgi:hypothetical protein